VRSARPLRKSPTDPPTGQPALGSRNGLPTSHETNKPVNNTASSTSGAGASKDEFIQTGRKKPYLRKAEPVLHPERESCANNLVRRPFRRAGLMFCRESGV
jgi:hypothetical protein